MAPTTSIADDLLNQPVPAVAADAPHPDLALVERALPGSTLGRLLQRVGADAWETALKGDGEERREFLRAIDAVKKRTQRGYKRSPQLLGVVSDGRDPQAMAARATGYWSSRPAN